MAPDLSAASTGDRRCATRLPLVSAPLGCSLQHSYGALFGAFLRYATSHNSPSLAMAL
jgi:hypothetical protein